MATVYMPTRPDEWQDLAQEGSVAMWRALRTYDPDKGALPSYLTTAAKWRMQECASRETWTGTMSSRGHIREKPATPVEPRMLDPDRCWTEMAEGVMLAYHRGEVGRVLSGFSLSVQSALYRKFWLDETVPHGLWCKAVPALAEQLSHLRSDYD